MDPNQVPNSDETVSRVASSYPLSTLGHFIVLAFLILFLDMQKTHYELLGVGRNRAIQTSHVDKGGDPQDNCRLNEAYQVLSDVERRRIYDESLSPKPTSSSSSPSTVCESDEEDDIFDLPPQERTSHKDEELRRQEKRLKDKLKEYEREAKKARDEQEAERKDRELKAAQSWRSHTFAAPPYPFSPVYYPQQSHPTNYASHHGPSHHHPSYSHHTSSYYPHSAYRHPAPYYQTEPNYLPPPNQHHSNYGPPQNQAPPTVTLSFCGPESSNKVYYREVAVVISVDRLLKELCEYHKKDPKKYELCYEGRSLFGGDPVPLSFHEKVLVIKKRS
ncbi:hypothetical protein PROFUN_14766 [Planoprotostelium fungivorum]|uniref:J domain-containing protein n=1 Tax=Planoprotostelium fungivorum TaxID=1890364 RepID=A0A2P6MYU0_9EUKA|nr:hypothetical protein PROFUN_14766 [Planoprotostelium fungivorum]